MVESALESVVWSREDTPAVLQEALRVLKEDYPIVEIPAADVGPVPGLAVRFEIVEETSVCHVTRQGHEVHVRAPNAALALRAVGALLAGLIPDGADWVEQAAFKTFGIMLDCSRNAVMTVAHFKTWLRRLALLGYNMAMLYTEDTYTLPDEPYFGYLRGAYTADELREIDAYAARLGIEMIPCIQTLGHMEQILKWPAYRQVRDTGSVLLVDEPATYALIDKMLARWSDVFRSRRVHIGMDETHDLGRGRFMDRFGYERAFDIFNRHLANVVARCKAHGLEPMIWSDMYFRLGSETGDYYDRACEIPQDVVDAIPPEVELVYWDYYHADKDFYLEWIARHRALGDPDTSAAAEPVMASGVWTWPTVWYDRARTEAYALPCIEACRASDVEEILFTMWGDDGSYCDFDSALAGLALVAEKAFASDVVSETLSTRFAAICGADYEMQCRASDLNNVLSPSAVLWDDPLLGLYVRHAEVHQEGILLEAEQNYRALVIALEGHTEAQAAGDLNHAWLLARALGAKLSLARQLIEAYAVRDAHALADVRRQIPEVLNALRALSDSFRALWLDHNKPFGLEVLQVRFGGLIARYEELDARLGDYLTGKIAHIPELEEAPTGNLGHTRYHRLATTSYIL
jgi:hypothetical protein